MNGLTLVLIVVQVTIVFGATSIKSLVKIKQEYGHDVKYCELDGLEMGLGSVVKYLKTCERCTCTKTGVSCETLPSAFSITEVENPNPKCMQVSIGCKNRWIRKNNNKKFCRPPKILSMIGK